MVDESHDEGMLDESEYERLAGALGFTSRTVDGRAAPARPARDRATAAPGPPTSRWSARNTGYSRFPVVGDDGELVGYLHIKDVLQADPHGRARVVEDKWIRPFAARARLGHAGQRAADAAGQGRAHGPRGRRRRRPSWAWSPSRTSSRSWSARSATRPTPTATDAARVGRGQRADPAGRPAPWWEAPRPGVHAECPAAASAKGTKAGVLHIRLNIFSDISDISEIRPQLSPAGSVNTIRVPRPRGRPRGDPAAVALDDPSCTPPGRSRARRTRCAAWARWKASKIWSRWLGRDADALVGHGHLDPVTDRAGR